MEGKTGRLGRPTLLACAGLLFLATPVAGSSVERYYYNAAPRGDETAESLEHIRVTIKNIDKHYSYTANVTRKGYRESVTLQTRLDGSFITARREVERDGESGSTVDTVWVNGDRVLVVRYKDGKKKVKEYDTPDDQDLAVGASLLLWLRRFSFEAGAERRVFMIDYSQRKVTVTVRYRGVESVVVPAGTYECHRIEVEVEVPILNPKITFWLTTESPHFMVRHEGKRGPLTRTYDTVLVSEAHTGQAPPKETNPPSE